MGRTRGCSSERALVRSAGSPGAAQDGAEEVPGPSSGAEVRTSREGKFGTLPSEMATPLAMVLTEVLQNAVQHGFRCVALPSN